MKSSEIGRRQQQGVAEKEKTSKKVKVGFGKGGGTEGERRNVKTFAEIERHEAQDSEMKNSESRVVLHPSLTSF